MKSDYEVDTYDEPRGCRNFLLFLLAIVATSYTAGALWGFPHALRAFVAWFLG